jgi:TonB-linked SusC/RagA family outer membrane protein
MKKNVKNVRYRYGGDRNLLKKMKLLVAFFFGGLLAVSANSYSQQTKLSLRMDGTTVREIFKQIEEKSEFIFFYNEDYIDVERKVDINVKDEQVESILNEVLKGTRNTYKIYDRQIVILSPEMKELPPIMNSKSFVQQKRDISGAVKDVNGLPLPGVSVVIKGTTIGTITDVNGQFKLSSAEAKLLVFSFVGMKSQEVSVEGKSSLNIVMEEEAVGLEEVVAVGYGTQKKVNLIGSVSSVDFDKATVQNRSLTNVSTLLSGTSSGVRVQQVNGLPSDNSEGQISIRGVGSLNASSTPLILVDGQVSDINSVNPNDVASVSILKDAASSAIYGSRASNGVILITTKTGKDSKGKVTFNYNNLLGVKTPSQAENLVSSTVDYMTLVNMMRANSGMTEKFSQQYIEEWRNGSKTDPINYPNTNWMHALIKDNFVMNHNFSAKGGNERISFYSSLNYFDDDGLIPNTGYIKVNFRNNLDYKINNWLKIGNNITLNRTKADPATIANGFQWMRATTPAVVPKHPDGRYGSGQLLAGEGGSNNPLMTVENARGETKNTQLQAKIYTVVIPFKGLSVTSSYFVDYNQQEKWSGAVYSDQWNFQTNRIGIDNTSGSRLTLTNESRRNERHIFDLYADYNITIKNHNLKMLAGYNSEYYELYYFNGAKSNLLTYNTNVLDAGSTDPQVGGNGTDYGMRSFFGRFSYNFKDRYMFESNLRYDGSSRFSPDNRWGLFPSFSAGWIISEENFWKSTFPALNFVKLRASYGQLGNNGIGNYEWQSFYESANYNFNNNIVTGLAYNSFGNSAITWEATDILNFGTDMRLFKSLSLTINYYNKITKNILAKLPIPNVNGGITAPRVNSAKVQNQGVELEAGYRFNIGKLEVNANANFSYNKNKILKYRGDLIDPRGDYQAWTEGQPIGIYWLKEVDRIIQDDAEANQLLASGYTFYPSTPGKGDFLYKNNNDDKVIGDDKDRVLKGNPIPLYTYGGNLGLTYKGFDFNMQFDGVAGWDKYLRNSLYSLNHQDGYQWPKEYMNAWTEQNPSTTIPKVYFSNPKNDQISDYYLRSSAFLKIRSMQFGYNLPKSLMQTAKIEKLRIFVNLENYFTFTKWPTNDPEVELPSAGGDQTYPLSKTFSMGLNVSF